MERRSVSVYSIKHSIYFCYRLDNYWKGLINYAALPGVSLNSLDSEPFRHLMRVLSPNCPVPAANTIKKRLLEESAQIYNEMAIELNAFKGYLTATIDLWTDSSMLRSYVGITLHFICGTRLIYRCVGVEELLGKHTAIQIKKCAIKKLQEVGIEMNDIFAIVTDNGRNIVAAFRHEQG